MKAPLFIGLCCSLIAGCYDISSIKSMDTAQVSITLDTQANQYNVQFSADFPHTLPADITWIFGDGYRSNSPHTSHSYPAPGRYNARLEYAYQGQIIKNNIEVFIPGNNIQLDISARQNITFDSDHNDPNLPFISNNITPQIIISPTLVSGVLLSAHSCQAGRLCNSGDEIDQYYVKLNTQDEITLHVISGAIDIQLEQLDGTTIMDMPIHATTFTVAANTLRESEYILKVQLNNQVQTARYLLETKPSPIKQHNYQPGKLIVTWQGQSLPELVDLGDKRLEGLNSGTLFQARNRLSNTGLVKNVSLNYYRKSFSQSNNVLNWQWPLQFQHINDLWQPLAARGEKPGGNVTVAVLDTGIFSNHENLIGLSQHSGYDFVSDPINSGDNDGWDDNPEDPGDNNQSYHGTHITGIIAAQPTPLDNSSGAITGIAWGVDLMPLRVLGLNGGTSFDMIQALRYAAGLENQTGQRPIKPADIINLSLGGKQFSAAEQATVNDVSNSGVIIVAAAGNQSLPRVSFPAGYQNVIAVGALTLQGTPASYSNYGSYLDLMAPGGECSDLHCSTGIRSLSVQGTVINNADVRHSTWQNLAGTSMASAHVSALLAIMRSALPALDSKQLHTLIAENILNHSNPEKPFDAQTGWGQLNSERILAFMDTSSLSHGQIWTTKKVFYLNKNERQTIPLIIRGDSPIDGFKLDYDHAALNASLSNHELTVHAKTDLSTAQIVNIHSNESHFLSLKVHAKTHAAPSIMDHLYVSVDQLDGSHSEFRAPQKGGKWQAFVETTFNKQNIQGSSDLDYDGVYCEPGEFCARIEGATLKDANIEIWGDIIFH